MGSERAAFSSEERGLSGDLVVSNPGSVFTHYTIKSYHMQVAIKSNAWFIVSHDSSRCLLVSPNPSLLYSRLSMRSSPISSNHCGLSTPNPHIERSRDRNLDLQKLTFRHLHWFIAEHQKVTNRPRQCSKKCIQLLGSLNAQKRQSRSGQAHAVHLRGPFCIH